MSKHRFTLPAAVFLLLIREGHVLLMRRKNTGWCDGDYDLPAGHIDGNETLVSSLKREAKEEIGVNIDAAHAKFVHLAHYIGDKEYLYVTFAVDSWQGKSSINEPEKCDDLRWFSILKLPSNLTPAAKTVLEAYNECEPYSEISKD